MNIKTILSAAMVSLLAIGAAHANEAAKFELKNVSGQAIAEVHLAPAGQSLGSDLLGEHYLPNGCSVNVMPAASGCRFDGKVAYRNTDTENFRNINLCRTTRISFANTRDYVWI